MLKHVQVASLIGADPKEIIFTSGATESNNLAIKGVANFYRDKKKHIITTQTDRETPSKKSRLPAKIKADFKLNRTQKF